MTEQSIASNSVACGPESIDAADVLFEVRAAFRRGETTIPIRKAMVCECCAPSGETFSPGPTLLEVDVVWPKGVKPRQAVQEVHAFCVAKARAEGVSVST